MHQLTQIIAACAVGLGVVATAVPASAETIFLKNGTQVSGKITKEDAETLVVETKEGRRKVPKKDVELLPTRDPMVSLATGLLLAGGGHLYNGMFDRAALYMGLGGLGGVAGYYAARQIRPSSPSTAAVTALVSYGIPMLIGAYDAYKATELMQNTPKYRIEYSEEGF